MKLEKVKTASEYMSYFQQEIFTSTLEDYPHLENYYQKLYENFLAVSEEQFSERELIHMIETDSPSFYREMIGLQKNSDINWSLVFLSEKNEK